MTVRSSHRADYPDRHLSAEADRCPVVAFRFGNHSAKSAPSDSSVIAPSLADRSAGHRTHHPA